MKTVVCWIALGGWALSFSTFVHAAMPQVDWARQLGTSESEGSMGVSTDGLGNVYISGVTLGSLGGPNSGGQDAFVSKYDDSGSLLWTRQLGTSLDDYNRGVSADGLGNVYITGYAFKDLARPSAILSDAFVSKYDALGSFLWTRQLGTSEQDLSFGVSADGLGNVYISGYTAGNLGGESAGNADAFVSKYDGTGDLLWTRQLGTDYFDQSTGVSADGLGNVYITGITGGSLARPNEDHLSNSFVSKYDATGDLLWTEQLGSSKGDRSFGVSADGLGNVYISGDTIGNLGGENAGGEDAFVSMFDDTGNLLWTRQLGTSYSDRSSGVSADGLGNVYITGGTNGNLDGGDNDGSQEVFVSKFDDAGNLLWTKQIGARFGVTSRAVSADGLGNVYFSGVSFEILGEKNAGKFDAYVVKLGEVPEPATFVLALLACLTLYWWRRTVR